MYVEDSKGTTSVPFRLDPMSKARLAWVKAQFPSIKPSGSLILRRALAHYLLHLEKVVLDPKKVEAEIAALKSNVAGDQVPWKKQPEFAEFPGKPLSAFTMEAHRAKIDAFLNHDYFGEKARKWGLM